ncbi:YqzG/YhdC family protein [Alicyclobacillus sp. ALC3]|nr:YqzG/YhdC family protein [Alicyclobacillus sp. ALC3]
MVNSTTVFAAPVKSIQSPYIKPEPDYAKWGKFAVSETQKRYPRASVVDYLHVGRQAVSPSTTREVFKLWLKDDKHEFGVYVRITFNTKTEQISKTSFQETNR